MTHLPQVATFAYAHYRITKESGKDSVTSDLAKLSASTRVEELARMLGDVEVTAKTRAHAKELLDTHGRSR